MGEEILKFYKTKLKREYKVAFISTFVISLLIHLYKFTNTLPNHDSVYNYYSDQNILGSGRWALSLACGISSYYDLPWIIGLLSCIFISLTMVVIVALFKMKNPVLIALSGALIAASPATTETLFFLFTADGYMMAMFLAALGVYFSRIEENRLSRLIFSGVCICISCGIYQAYVSFALILALCYFIDILLQNNHKKEDCFKWVFHQVIIYIISLAVYYVIWKLCMYFSNTVANNYQGISEVGKISVGLLVNGLVSSIKSSILYFVQFNVLKHGFTLYSVLNILFIVTMVVGLIISCMNSGIFYRKWALGLFILCLVAIIPFACIWNFTSDSILYRPMMLQSLTLLFIMTALLYERWSISAVKNIVCIFLIVITLNNSIMANISYFYMNLCYERTYAEGLEMMMKIHDFQDKYKFDKIAVVGNRAYNVFLENIDLQKGKIQGSTKILILSSNLEKSLLFDSEHTIRFLQATFGLELKSLNLEQRKDLFNTDEVKSMSCWPAGDSITVIDNTLVIKLSDKIEGE